MSLASGIPNLTLGNFNEILDNRGNPYFFFAEASSHYSVNASEEIYISSFLQDVLNITRRRTTIFTKDLSPRDDIFIAILSLLLLLLIEGLVTAILMRTSARGTISKSNFAIQHLVELFRDLRFRRPTRARRSTVRWHFVFLALLFCASTFALEVIVLFLTDERFRYVTNSKVSLRLINPLTPEWLHIRFHQRVSINRACNAVSLVPVEQKTTSISSCVVSSLPVAEYIFEKNQTGQSQYIIRSSLHDYGAEHEVHIGDMKANYSARAFFEYQDGNERLMSRAREWDESNLKERVGMIHRLYIGFLMTSFVRATKNTDHVNLEVLRQSEFNTVELSRSTVRILKHNESTGFLTASARRFETVVEAPNVGANISLAYAQSVFKSSIGIMVSDANASDALINSGDVRHVDAVIWGEKARVINVLALLVLLGLTGTLLVGLRFMFRPVAVEDLAGMYVRGKVGAERGRGPLTMSEQERKYFYVDSTSSVGAGLEEGVSYEEDYDDYDDATWSRTTVGTGGTSERRF